MNSEVKKQYGLWTGIAMVIGIVIGSGVFIKADDVLKQSGGDLKLSLLAWFVGGLIMVASGFCFAVFATKVTKFNGVIDYVEVATNKKIGYGLGWLVSTFYYPIIKSILKFFGVSVTKGAFAKGVSKVIPFVGGVVSGGITLASMLPMGNRLANTLDKAHFDYNDNDFNADIRDISIVCEQSEEELYESTIEKEDEIFIQIQKAKQMLDEGIITESEFSEIKAKLILLDETELNDYTIGSCVEVFGVNNLGLIYFETKILEKDGFDISYDYDFEEGYEY